MITLEFNKDLLWCSDWSGDEVGYDDVDVVGLYRVKDTNLYLYIDVYNNKILDGWSDNEDEF